jgi:thiamine-monophosphate kinase
MPGPAKLSEMPSEFDLIARFFTRPAPNAVLGVGDDGALLAPSPGAQLVLTTDMLLADRHFFPDADPFLLGHKALAVNLSDLAAMGAVPRWASLSLALPEVNEGWLAEFSRGFFDLAERYNVSLVGGDTTRGPLNLCVTLLGEVPAGRALRRDGARAGDDIWVSGDLGGAALGLCHLLGEVSLGTAEADSCLGRLHRPEPRVVLGDMLTCVAHAAIDISDGLLADLGHILKRSGVGAVIDFNRLPAHQAVAARLDDAIARRCLLAGGDDYELCFTAPPDRGRAVMAVARSAGAPVVRIGRVTVEHGLRLLDGEGIAMDIRERGFDHFA